MSRVIRKSRSHSADEAADLLTGLFSAELCDPSGCTWLVSPWISDVELLDNTAGTFGSLQRFGRRKIRLAEILVALATQGSIVVIGTTADSHNDTFLRRLNGLAKDLRVEDRVQIVVDSSNRLHTKAFTGDDFALAGSMNITFNGIQVREEHVELRTDTQFVAQARMDAFERFGGAL